MYSKVTVLVASVGSVQYFLDSVPVVTSTAKRRSTSLLGQDKKLKRKGRKQFESELGVKGRE